MSAFIDSLQALQRGLGSTTRFADSLTEAVIYEAMKASGVATVRRR